MIFDVFTLVFKSNAKEVIQGNKEAAKSTKDLENQLKNTGDEAEKTAQRYKEITEAATKAVAAVISYGALKSGVLGTAKFNSELQVTSKIIGQNANDMLVFGAAVESAGGSVEGLQGAIKNAFGNAASAGLPLGKFDEYFDRVRKRIQGLSGNEQYRVLNDLYGITDQGLINLLTMGEEDYQKAIATARDHAQVTEKSLQLSREFDKQLAETGQSLQSFWSSINEFVLPVLTSGLKGMNEFFQIVKENKGASIAFLTAFASGAGLLALQSVKASAGVLGIGAAVTKILAPLGLLLSRLTAIGAIVTTAFVLPEAGKRGGKWVYDNIIEGSDFHKWVNRKTGWDNGRANGRPESGPMINQNSDATAFFRSKGYNDEEISAIMSNIHHESGGDAAARGDGGRAHGIAQWHPDRRAKILKGTGIDVSTASYAEQLHALEWEMRNEDIFDVNEFKRLQGADAKAAYFSKNFERPADREGEAFKRARTALGYMSSFPMNSFGQGGSSSSKSMSVKIDKVEVNTQATDAQGIARGINDELQRELGYATGNMDDGVMM